MRLSKAQQTVMDDAKNKIDFARSVSYYEWIKKRFLPYKDVTDEQILEMIEHDKKIFSYDYIAKRFEEEKNGITIVHCNSKTLCKLQEYGLIEIIEDSKGQTYGIDTIKVLNY